MNIRWMSSLCLVSFLLLLGSLGTLRALGQCAGIATTPTVAADCAGHAVPQNRVATIDPSHPYTLAELIDIAERNNPRARIQWERARQRAEALGVEKSAYFPVLAGLAAFGDSRSIAPFPKPFAPRGYTMVEIPVIEPEITLQYLIFDFGKREGRVDEAAAQKIAAGANFIAANQQVAFRAAAAYYELLTAQERLEAARETLKTAQTTQDAAEDRMNNGRATMPDVLNARAETAQSLFDLESADGDEKIAPRQTHRGHRRRSFA
jgi:outer membrane protein